MKNPPCQKAWRVSELSFSVNSTSSLAVFYVEQVALNRHVTPCLRLPPFILELEVIVKAKVTSPLADNIFGVLCVKRVGVDRLLPGPGRMASLTSRRIA